MSCFSASPLKQWCTECFGNWRKRSSMVPKLRQLEKFLTSNLCIPGLLRIPNYMVIEALMPYCVCFHADFSSAVVCCHFRCSKKSTIILLPAPPFLCVLSSWGPPCWQRYECTQCARTALLAAWPLQLYLHHKLTLKEYMTCQHDLGLHYRTAHLDIIRSKQQVQWFSRKWRKESNYKSFILFLKAEWNQLLSG